MRSQHIPMTIEQYHLLPLKPGWKREYIDGEAHIQPRNTAATLTISVGPRPVNASYPLREVTPEDAPALIAAFYEAFRDTCEYCDWPDAKIRESASKCITTFFAGQRGETHSASRLAVETATATGREEVIGAALLVRDNDGPYLDMLFVRPHWQRRGLATALVSAAMNALHAAGEPTLRSAYDIANDPSVA
ncbi:MAG TPA: GNAT family N-acetyltransferase [Chthonomonadaceae bacterium]|nr:GNAT family N-acetyltransferase [Chthonomonadaceae bacterium]